MFSEEYLMSLAEVQSSQSRHNFRSVVMTVVVMKTPTHPVENLGQIFTQSAGTMVTTMLPTNSAPLFIKVGLRGHFDKLVLDCPEAGYQNIHEWPTEFTDGIRNHLVHENFHRSYHWNKDGFLVFVRFSPTEANKS